MESFHVRIDSEMDAYFSQLSSHDDKINIPIVPYETPVIG